jgi:hypothetical protein
MSDERRRRSQAASGEQRSCRSLQRGQIGIGELYEVKRVLSGDGREPRDRGVRPELLVDTVPYLVNVVPRAQLVEERRRFDLDIRVFERNNNDRFNAERLDEPEASRRVVILGP